MEQKSSVFYILRPTDSVGMTANFVYRVFNKYEYAETVKEGESSFEDKEGIPCRWVHIKIIPSSSLNSDNLGSLDTNEMTLGSDLPSEMDLNLGVIKLTTISSEEKEYITKVLGTNNSGRTPYEENLLAHLSGIPTKDWPSGTLTDEGIWPEIEESTGRAVNKTEVNPDYFQKASWISEYYSDNIASSIMRNPISEDANSYGLYEKLSFIARRRASEKYKRFTNTGSVFNLFENLSTLTGVDDNTVAGYAIAKYSNDSNEPDWVKATNSSNYYDTEVLYGSTYRYIIYPIVVYKGKLILLNDETSISVECIEQIPPSPPTNLQITWKRDQKFLIQWRPGTKEIEVELPPSSGNQGPNKIDPNDIKGYQIFIRNSLEEPYTLVRYIDFNDVEPKEYREKAKENIPAEYILSVNPNDASRRLSYQVDLRSNTDYYIAMCSIDAHGNSSSYSTQYYVRRNSVTGEVRVSAVSSAGAPKTQPNLLIPGRLIKDSMYASNYRRCNVYFNPELSRSFPDVGQSVEVEFLDTKTDTVSSVVYDIKNN